MTQPLTVPVFTSVSSETLQDCINFAKGVFAPLQGFMNSSDYHSVVGNMTLGDGTVWTIPLSLDIEHEVYLAAADAERIGLHYEGEEIGFVEIEDCYRVNIEQDIICVYQTSDSTHPGVNKERQRSPFRIGGKVTVTKSALLDGELDPKVTKNYFAQQGWQTIAGFQTRNPVHRAHEHLQRTALEVCDGLFINPLVGWKKVGDFSEEAVVSGYRAMLDTYYDGLNVYFDTLKTPMRYAGPREAIFHAIIRRNLGCTHFIIGRDHAGVGGFYDKYAAQELARKITEEYDIGIELLLLSEPFYCHVCGHVVSEHTCAHSEEYTEKISGSKIRELLSMEQRPDSTLMRSEVADAIISLKDKKFITE